MFYPDPEKGVEQNIKAFSFNGVNFTSLFNEDIHFAFFILFTGVIMDWGIACHYLQKLFYEIESRSERQRKCY